MVILREEKFRYSCSIIKDKRDIGEAIIHHIRMGWQKMDT